MNTPPLLLGAALVFWGWQTGLLPIAVAVAVLLEGSRLVTWRWDLSRGDFDRVADLCRLVLIVMAVYLAATRGVARSVLILAQWFPLAVLLLVACQAYGPTDRVELRTFALILRRGRADDRASASPVQLAYPYFALLILAASAANVRTPLFYAGLCVLVPWALWPMRSPRFSPLVWGGVLAVAAGLGYGGHRGLYELQALVEGTIVGWFYDFRKDDEYRGVTAIGRIGRLKLSDRILLRVDTGAPGGPPLLLHEASFNLYSAGDWGTVDAAFAPMRPEPDLRTWRLAQVAPAGRPVTVSAYLKRGQGLLAIPHEAARLEGLTVVRLTRNRLDALRVEEGPGLVTYGVRSSPGLWLGGASDATDLVLPRPETPIVSRIAAELGLRSRPPREALTTVAAYFRDNFRYSTYLDARQRGTTALEDFFLRSRAGHCEYFATATVLLLRAAGIPARYATGYAVQEWSPREQLYVVRHRHAHAWALAYVDGAWRELDTTPSLWATVEAQSTAWWQPLADLWSWGWFLFERWRWGERESSLGRYLGWLLLPLLAVLAWRLYRSRRVARGRAAPAAGARRAAWPGEDSEFYAIERRLAALGLGRHPWEPVSSWVRRLDEVRRDAVPTADLRAIAALHCRYRFDPDGVSPAERDALRSAVQAWLDRAERVQSSP